MTTIQNPAASSAASSSSSSATSPPLDANNVGTMFLKQYYTILSKEPKKLHMFYQKVSSFTHGYENEEVKICTGQQEIFDSILKFRFEGAKVVVSHMDFQPSLENGVIVLVVGELSNRGEPYRRFVQTIFLAADKNTANRFYVHNDIFRYLKQDQPVVPPVVPQQQQQQQPPLPGFTGLPAGLESVRPPMKHVRPPQMVPVDVGHFTMIKPIHDDSANPSEATTNANGNSSTTAPAAAAAATTTTPVSSTNTTTAAAASTSTTTPAAAATNTPATPSGTSSTASNAAPSSSSAPTAAAAAAPAAVATTKHAPSSWAATVAASASTPASSTTTTTTTAPSAAAPAAVNAPSAAAAAAAPAASNIPNGVGDGEAKGRPHGRRIQNPETGIYVRGIAPGMNEQELRALFGKVGQMTECKIVFSRKCAFVEYATMELARQALATTFQIGGVTLEVQKQDPHKASQPHGGRQQPHHQQQQHQQPQQQQPQQQHPTSPNQGQPQQQQGHMGAGGRGGRGGGSGSDRGRMNNRGAPPAGGVVPTGIPAAAAAASPAAVGVPASGAGAGAGNGRNNNGRQPSARPRRETPVESA